MPPERARFAKLCAALELAATLAKEILDEWPDDTSATQGARGPGRPVAAPTDWQVREAVRLRHVNGRLWLRAIGAQVGLSWHVVKRILDEFAPEEVPSGNPLVPSEKPSSRQAATASSRKPKPRKGR
jgi:hypothetical protein